MGTWRIKYIKKEDREMNGFGQKLAISMFNEGYEQCKRDLEEKIKQLKTYGWNMDKTLIGLEDVLELLEIEE